MTSCARPFARAGLGLVALGLVTARASAQPSRFHLSRSLSLVQVYDDNLFSTPAARRADYIWRLSPRVGIGHASRRLTLAARYGLDAELFRRHPELNTAVAGQDAALELGWAPSRLLAASASASYAQAQAPGELNTVTGLQAGRVRARRLSAAGSLTWQLGVRTKATVEPRFIREEFAGGQGNDTQVATLAAERRLGPVDRGRVSYGARRFVFGQKQTESHVVTLGWSREITPLAHFELEAGPRLTGHTVGAEVAAALKHRFRSGDASLAYLHSQTTVLGEPGPVTAEGLSATFSRQLLGSVRIAGGPASFRVRGERSEATVHRLNLEVTWPVTRRLVVVASHQFSLQRGGLGLGGTPMPEIVHNALLVRLTAASAGY